MNTTSRIYDVIISGAGPVGLFLACELALAKCSVLVLEKAVDPHSPLKQLPFGIRGLSTPTIEALDRRALLAELELHKRLKNPHKTSTPEGPLRQIGHFAGIPFLEGNVDISRWPNRLPTSTPTSLISSIEELETVFTRRAESLGVSIRRGQAITDLQSSNDSVTVHSNGQTFHAKWLVGCDGSRSVVRKIGAFEFAGTDPEFTGYSIQLDIADPGKLSPGRNLTPAGMYFQSQPGYLVMVEFDGGAGHTASPPTLERIQQTLRRVSNTDVTISALHNATTWTDRARQATTYRDGRLLLAGDAAHIHAPLGGQGLNLGIGDAMNLGWKLAATIHNTAPADLLDTYYTERRPIGAQVLDWSRAQVAIMRPDPAARALTAIIRDLMDTRDAATYFAARVWGINTHYNLPGAHLLTGHTAPNFEFADGTTLNEHLTNGKALLLDFSANPSLQTLANRYPNHLTYITTNTTNPLNLATALIRPDGYISYAVSTLANLDEVTQAASRIFQNRSV
jgi:2-polyprenyl-6-methoxyphenol hydroxylase-like FAD-dependent oxidoreductase